MRLFPEVSGDLQRFDLEVVPPGHFIADLMQLPVMTAAERNRELVADFEADRSRLGEPQVKRIARLPPADEARLRGDEPEMRLVAQAFGLGDGEKAFVDTAGDGF